MKTTIELPDTLLIQAKRYAEARGKTFRQVVIEALTSLVSDEELEVQRPGIEPLFGAFAHDKEETQRIQEIINETRSPKFGGRITAESVDVSSLSRQEIYD